MGAGIQPGGTAAHALHPQRAALQIDIVDIGDLQLAARRRFDLLGNLDHIVVVEIETGDGVVRLRLGRFLLNRDRLPLLVELHHAVALRILHVIAKYRGSARLAGRLLQRLAQTVAVEDVVAEDQTDRVVTNKRLANQKCLRQPIRTRLHRVLDRQPPLAAVTENALIGGLIVRRADDQDLANTGQHQRGQRVVDHRLVVDRQQLFVDADGCRMQPGATAPGQNNAFHRLLSSGIGPDML